MYLKTKLRVISKHALTSRKLKNYLQIYFRSILICIKM